MSQSDLSIPHQETSLASVLSFDLPHSNGVFALLVLELLEMEPSVSFLQDFKVFFQGLVLAIFNGDCSY